MKLHLGLLPALFLALTGLSQTAGAVQYFWVQRSTCGPASWFDSECWDLNVIPGNGHSANLASPYNGSSYTVTYGDARKTTLSNLRVGSAAFYTSNTSYEEGHVYFSVTDSAAVIETGSMQVGFGTLHAGAHATVNQASGNVLVGKTWADASNTYSPGSLDIGMYEADYGTYNLSGGYLATETTTVGVMSKGLGGNIASFIHNSPTGVATNAKHETRNLTVAEHQNSMGQYVLGAGHLISYGQDIGRGGTGTFTQQNLFNYNQTHYLNLGRMFGGSGTYDMQGGSLFASTEIVGNEGTGSFVQWGGLNEIRGQIVEGIDPNPETFGSLVLGVFGNGRGSYTMNGTVMGGGNPELRAQNEIIGDFGTGTFTQNGGINTVGSLLRIGQIGGSNGSYSFSEGTLTAPTLEVGVAGTGTFTQDYGNANIAAALVVGKDTGSVGTYTMQGWGVLQARPFSYEWVDGVYQAMERLPVPNQTIGLNGTGTFNQMSGNNFVGALLIGSGSGNGTYNMSGGSLEASSIQVGTGSGTGTLNVTNGRVSVYSGNITIGSNGTVNLSRSDPYTSSTLTALTLTNRGTINYTGGRLDIGGDSACSIDCNPNAIGLTNNGTLNISAPNADFFTKVVNNGTIKITDTRVSFGGGLENNGAYISDPSTNSFSSLVIGVNGYLQGGAGDAFVVSGNFINGSTQTALWNTRSASLTLYGYSPLIFDYGDVTNKYDFAWGTLETNGNFTFSGTGDLYVDNLILGYSANVNLAGHNVYYKTLTTTDYSQLIGNEYLHQFAGIPAAVPEPESYAMLLAGLGLMGAIARRRIAKQIS